MRGTHETRRDVVGAIGVGFLFILVAGMLVVVPDLLARAGEFLRDLEVQQLAPGFYFPAPRSPHPILYNAMMYLCLGMAGFELFALLTRLVLGDPIQGKAGTFSSMIFWAGASWTLGLLADSSISWLVFLGSLLTLIGVRIVLEALIMIAFSAMRKRQ